MTSLWVGFPEDINDRLELGGSQIVSATNTKYSSISDWLSSCQIAATVGQRTPKPDLVVIYAHAALTTYAFRQDYEGVELLKHLRVANSGPLGNLRDSHVIIVAWESAEAIIKRSLGNTILLSSGVSLFRLPDAIEILSNRDELEKLALEKANLNDPRLWASVRADYRPPDSAHQISNWWGAWRLIQSIAGSDAKMPKPVCEKISLLSTKQALFLQGHTDPEKQYGLPRTSIDRLRRRVAKSAPTICYVDDEADQGWEQAFRTLLYGDGASGGFEVVNPLKDKCVRSVSDLADQILGLAPNLLILDLRLGGSDEVSKAPKETSGALLLEEIRKESKGLPILLMTASNKARMLQDVMKLGADAYWMKEGIGEHAPLYPVENPTIELIRLLEALLGDDWQFLLRFEKAQKALRGAAESSQCWWSSEKRWKPVYWPYTNPPVPAPQTTLVSTSPDTANPTSILSQIAALYREYLSQDLFTYYGEPRSAESKDLWLRGIAIHAARLVEAVHRYDQMETYAENHNLEPMVPPGLVRRRGDALGQGIISHRNGAAHYKPNVRFDESRTRELLGLLATWLTLDPLSYSLGQPVGQGGDQDRLREALGRYAKFDQSEPSKFHKLMFIDLPLPDEGRSAKLLASPDLPRIRQDEGRRIGADALLRVVELESGHRAALALQYLQPFAQSGPVQRALQDRWISASTPSSIKAHLIWRIGDDQNVRTEFKSRMRTWILNNFDVWTQSAYEFFSATPEDILDAIRNKLDASSVYPEYKKWIVICCVPISSQKEAARLLLSSLSSKDEFVETTRIAVLDRIGDPIRERSRAAG